jgi:hypothetical protein
MGARFFTHVQTGPGAHPASCTMGTGSFPGIKRPGRGADHPPLLVLRLRMSRDIPLLTLQGHEACNRVRCTFNNMNGRSWWPSVLQLSITGIADSNPAEGLNVRLLGMLCVVQVETSATS